MRGLFYFLKDAAPAHNCKTARLFLKKKKNALSIKDALSSPDLNPIENLLGAIKRILQKETINSKEELKKNFFLEIWESFPQLSIDRLVSSFNRRLRLLISQNEKSIIYLLRTSLYDIAPFQFPNKNFLKFYDLAELYVPDVNDETVEFLNKRQYKTDEDILLLQQKKDGMSFY